MLGFSAKAFNFSPLRMILAVGLSSIAFTILRYVSSIPTLVRVFIMNQCWISWNAFNASIERTMWFLSFVMWYITLIDLHMFNHPCKLGMELIFLWCMIFLMCYVIQFADILLRTLYLYLLKIWACNFLFLWCLWLVLLPGWWWLHRISLGVFLPNNILEEFEKVRYKFFFVCLVEFACGVIWSRTFAYRES